mgnify:CR=1 FL=1
MAMTSGDVLNLVIFAIALLTGFVWGVLTGRKMRKP